ncbi:MAG: HEAT repeat domain-containing protein [Methanobrevibacter sp.]|nr:HEAT repeat domain-containing protein [Methanobrevibacter sp.]MBQ2354169.1 HEAT repeat domain-containing protein [Methanobrevibacter sp.]
MSDDIKKQLAQAKKNYQNKDYEGAKDLYETLYNQKPESFTIWDKRFYSWALYQLYVKNPDDETSLLEAVDMITELVAQEDHSQKDGVCAYTMSVMKLLDYLYKKHDYANLLIWADNLNPDFLSTKTSKFTTNDGREVTTASNKEKYYNWTSKSYQEVEDYDMCLEVSKKALEELTSFTNNSDVWFKWRIARSLREIGEYGEAIEYLKDIYKTKKDWFIRWELAENYFFEGDHEKSLEYAVSAALSHGDSDKKIKLYSLLEDLLEDDDPEIALKHSYLIYSIRLHNEWGIDEELEEKIESAGLDTQNTEYWKIEKELKGYWKDLKFKHQQPNYGIISRIFPHGKTGFVKRDDGESFFFNGFEFKGDPNKYRENVKVRFYLEEGYDRKKDEVKMNAVNIVEV